MNQASAKQAQKQDLPHHLRLSAYYAVVSLSWIAWCFGTVGFTRLVVVGGAGGRSVPAPADWELWIRISAGGSVAFVLGCLALSELCKGLKQRRAGE